MRKKTQKAVKALDHIIEFLKSDGIYETYDYKSRREFFLKGPINEVLKVGIREYYLRKNPHYRNTTLERKVLKALTYEGDIKKSIAGTMLFGVSHRPDYVVELDGIRIAIEIKCDDSGSGIREGLGQALVYSTDYDFVIYLFIDTSKGSSIASNMEEKNEKSIIESLWRNYNICFELV
jgi:hypothetical protein